MSEPKLSVIRGGRVGKTDVPPHKPEVYRTPASAARMREHSAESESGVISILDGWIRVLERQARSVEP